MEHQASGTHSTRQPCEAAEYVDSLDPKPKPCGHGDWRVLWVPYKDHPYTFVGKYACCHHEARHIQYLKEKTQAFWGTRKRTVPDPEPTTLF